MNDTAGPMALPHDAMRRTADGWYETARNVVYPWHIDQLGHMNVQHYVGMFDIAGFHFFAAIGYGFSKDPEAGMSLVDARHTIEYKVEQRAGSLLRIESAILKLGTKSVSLRHRMINTETGDLAATLEVVAVFFDLATRQSVKIPNDVRANLQRFIAPAVD